MGKKTIKTARGDARPTGPATVVQEPMSAAAPKAGDKLVRGGTTTGRPGQIVTAANRWRENYNPLRGLTMRRAVELLELGQRGDTAYLQWTFRLIERRHPTLSALVKRCLAPLVNFDWTIKIKKDLPPGATQAMAEAQQGTLEDAYGAIDNLKAAIKHLAAADFKGYAHLQKHYAPDGDVMHLECLNQWCVCRDGLAGNWFWNADSRSTTQPLVFLGKDFCIGGDALPLEDFIIREVEMPIDEIALINYVRASLCEKDADAFIEIYGIPGGVVVMPPNVPPGKEAEYEQAAKNVAEGGSGAIPNGSDYKPNDGPRGVDPFSPRLQHLDEQLIMAGTGGLLTMLAQSGSGTLAGNAHADTFQAIAESIALEITECFQRQFDAGILEKYHGDEPALVYFELAAKDETDVAALVKDVVALYAAGVEPDVEWLKEKTGYELIKAAPDDGQTLEEADALKEDNAELGPKDQPLANRQAKLASNGGKDLAAGHLSRRAPKILNAVQDAAAPSLGFMDNLTQGVSAAVSPDLLIIEKKLAGLLKITDPELLRSRAREILSWISDNEEHLTNNPQLADTLHQGLATAFQNGLTAKT